ncbi:hypothetical protein UA08_03439 [Talaromyces atroroseus]|uniref:Zn(2)-C6 fungal-type domain-containing protein n=1 Tax=Talaromyces atroroseus TaxID=1441469 RepID=A0A225AT90_TALAT|nr:hypothetical protein UA08_03439 [Talaromyces atroroseus]OKL61574.1 hypothetical protein UA08_03439 [Talaromyces atroroseus]
MTVLRKACRNCTFSKRKCVVQLPRCARCAQKGLDCTYDLEPLSVPTAQPESLPKLSFNPSSCDTPGYCVMKTFQSRASTGIEPEYCRPGHLDALEIVRMSYQRLPDLIRVGKPAFFIHPKLQLRSNRNHLAIFERSGKSGVNYENFQRLIQLDIKTAPVEEALPALQALLIYLASYFFPPGQLGEDTVEQFLNILSEWTQTLLASAQTGMPRGPSAWQEWLFGESIRRTIVMSYALVMAVSSFNYGYCSHWLFIESLPFDKRPGLWMAESPQAWIAAARARTGEEVGEQLNSFHEFAISCDGSDLSFCGDEFLALLAFAHNGKSDTAQSWCELDRIGV